MNGQFEYVIGMDCGTTNIKAVVLRSDGKVVASQSRANSFSQPGHRMHEQDALQWWKSAVEIFNSLVCSMEQSEVNRINGICVSSHTVTLLPVDADGTPLRPAVTYQDGRSVAQMHEILDKVGRDSFINIVGGQPSVAFLPNKILWYRIYEPDLYEKTDSFLQASSYINFRLTGVMSGDIDQALRTQCMDISTLKWSEKIGNAIGVDLDQKMPKVYQVDDIIGRVSHEASLETHLPEGIPVLAGCSDAMAAMFATGMSKLGEAGESSGTTSLVFVGSDVKSDTTVPVVTRPCPIDGMPWIFDAPIQSTGASVRWFIDKLAFDEKAGAEQKGISIYDHLNKLALESVPGSHGLFFFPYLMGERAPLWNDYARGMMIGLGMDTERCDFVRSIFEGTAYALRHVIETVRKSGGKAQLLRICGGGARSRTWNMIKASMLDMPVYVLDSESGDVPVGCALIAGHKTGIFPDLAQASEKTVRVSEVIEPIPDWTEVYNELFPHYLHLYECLDSELSLLHSATRKIEEKRK